jgi:hypothetical protein
VQRQRKRGIKRVASILCIAAAHAQRRYAANLSISAITHKNNSLKTLGRKSMKASRDFFATETS